MLLYDGASQSVMHTSNTVSVPFCQKLRSMISPRSPRVTFGFVGLDESMICAAEDTVVVSGLFDCCVGVDDIILLLLSS